VNAAAVLPVAVACLVAAASVGVAAGPASGFARSYLGRLEPGAAPGASPTAPSGPGPRIRARGLLERRPQAVLATILCTVTLAWGLGHGTPAETALTLPVIALLGVAGSVDVVCHRLPDRLLGAAALWLLAVRVAQALGNMLLVAPSAAGAWRVRRAVLCALVVGAAALVVWLIRASGMGLGDVKLCALLGLWLGYAGVGHVVTGLMLSFVLAGLAAIGLVITGRTGLKDTIAFGPYLVAGGWLAWMLAVA